MEKSLEYIGADSSEKETDLTKRTKRKRKRTSEYLASRIFDWPSRRGHDENGPKNDANEESILDKIKRLFLGERKDRNLAERETNTIKDSRIHKFMKFILDRVLMVTTYGGTQEQDAQTNIQSCPAEVASEDIVENIELPEEELEIPNDADTEPTPQEQITQQIYFEEQEQIYDIEAADGDREPSGPNSRYSVDSYDLHRSYHYRVKEEVESLAPIKIERELKNKDKEISKLESEVDRLEMNQKALRTAVKRDERNRSESGATITYATSRKGVENRAELVDKNHARMSHQRLFDATEEKKVQEAYNGNIGSGRLPRRNGLRTNTSENIHQQKSGVEQSNASAKIEKNTENQYVMQKSSESRTQEVAKEEIGRWEAPAAKLTESPEVALAINSAEASNSIIASGHFPAHAGDTSKTKQSTKHDKQIAREYARTNISDMSIRELATLAGLIISFTVMLLLLAQSVLN